MEAVVFVVIGWFALVIGLAFVSMSVGVMIANYGGRFNIGGAPNRPALRAVVWIVGVVVVYMWIKLLSNSPFTMALKGT